MAGNAQAGAIAIVGAGSIGTGWAVVFAAAGHRVRLFDPAADRLGAAVDEIAARVDDGGLAGGIAPDDGAVLRKRGDGNGVVAEHGRAVRA